MLTLRKNFAQSVKLCTSHTVKYMHRNLFKVSNLPVFRMIDAGFVLSKDVNKTVFKVFKRRTILQS